MAGNFDGRGRALSCMVLVAIFYVQTQISLWKFLEKQHDRFLSCQSTSFPDSQDSRKQIASPSSDKTGVTAPPTFSVENDFDILSFARSFPRWNRELPCFPADPDWMDVSSLRRLMKIPEGFLYFKPYKAASSTVAGVALRIARSIAQSRNDINTTICRSRYGHQPSWSMKYRNRDKLRSFLWTIIREPTSRYVSQFFHFKVSRGKVEPTDKIFRQSYLGKDVQRADNYYLRSMNLHSRYHPSGPEQHAEIVQHIMEEYDFIGISERMDESLVALQMILGLNTSDILYLNSKASGGFDDALRNHKCSYIVPSFVTPDMKEFFVTSKKWYNFTRGDTLLYHAVNVSLDRTIDSLGRSDFEEKLATFQRALGKARSDCTNVTYPCSAGGEVNTANDCFIYDFGCGYKCLDRVGSELRV